MEDATYKPVTVGDWVLTFLLMCIPLVNLIMLFVWAFGGNAPISKANWAKAALIWTLIAIAIYFIIFLIFVAIGIVASTV